MKLKYVTNISDKSNEATILLGKQIGNTLDKDGNVIRYGINGFDFANEIKYVTEQMGKNVTVDINCPGGSVIEGYTIAHAIKAYGCDTNVVGLAASMAFVCACMGAKRTAVSHASLMSHPVKSDDEKGQAIFNDSLINMVTVATKMNGDTAKQMFEKETWVSNSKKADYNLSDAISMGILDEIKETGKKLPINKANLTVENLYAVYNQLTETHNMKNITAVLNLKETDDETKVVETITNLKNENESLKTKVAALELEKTNKDTADNAAKKLAATNLVEKAITDKKVKAEEKDGLIALAETNFETVKNLLDAKGTAAVNVLNQKTPVTPVVGRETWTIRDYEKKAPKELAKIQNETPEVYNQMYENYYKLGIGNSTFNK